MFDRSLLLKQSPNDKKHYLPITLNNGLRVLLIENMESDKAAAALAVNAGHFDDPKDREGLAHFVEHMLFLGTERFPDGSEYQKFISQHGGHNNAWTGTEHTCYFFDIHHAHLTPALERFADFFIAPLLSEELVDSERQNIDAEFKLKLKDDIRRLYDVHKATVNQAHPFSQFSVGNLHTLGDTEASKVRDDIAAYFERYYRAELMTLVIEAPIPVQSLKNLAHQYFEAIPSGGQKKNITQPLYLPEHLGVEISVQPVKNERQLIISFALPSIDKYYKHKPESLLTYLLGHEGKGSILSYLKAKQWALGLTAGSGINGSNFKDFNISISLTENGEQHLDDVVDVVFSYIQLLKTQPLPHYVYYEKQKLANVAFEYLEKLKPIDSVNQLVISMQHYPVEDYIFGDFVMEGVCESSVNEILSFIHIENCRIVKIGQDHDCSSTTKWYKVPYHLERIGDDRIQALSNVNVIPELHLPDENPYIVESPKVHPHVLASNTPSMLESENGLCVWYKQDTTYKVPKGYIYICIDSPVAVSSNENIAMTRLFTDLFTSLVIEEHYDAELAGIHYNLYAHQSGITLQLSGLSEKQPLLLSKLLNSLTEQHFDEAQFLLIKAQLLKHWENADKSKSISQLFSRLSAFMQPNNPCAESLSKALSLVTVDQFRVFARKLFEHVTLEVLIHGNWLESHAHEISTVIKDAFGHNYDKRNQVACPVTDLAEQQEIILPVCLPNHDHATVCYYAVAEKSEQATALAMITSHLLAPVFFQEMRTEKQYGYLVNIGYIPISRYPGIGFYIQSPNTSAEELTKAIDGFISNAITHIDEIDNEQWYIFKQGLTAQLKEKDTSLRTKSQRFWAAISNQDYQFNRKQLLLDAINEITLEDIKHFICDSLHQHADNAFTSRVTLISSKQKELAEDWHDRSALVLCDNEAFNHSFRHKY